MKAMLFLIIIALVIWLGFAINSYNRQLTQDKQTIAELTEKLKAGEQMPSLELQAKCADSAKRFFESPDIREHSGGAQYLSHYNPKLHKCFVMVKAWDYDDKTMLKFVLSKNVFDAVEGKQYGQYAMHMNLRISENSLVLCEGQASDGSQKKCSSEEEFGALMSNYIDTREM